MERQTEAEKETDTERETESDRKTERDRDTERHTLRASLSGTFLQTLADLVTPLKPLH